MSIDIRHSDYDCRPKVMMANKFWNGRTFIVGGKHYHLKLALGYLSH